MTLPNAWRYDRKLAAALRVLSPAEQRSRLGAEIHRRPLEMTARIYGLTAFGLQALLNYVPPAKAGAWGPVGPHSLRLRIPKNFNWKAYAAENRKRLDQQLISQAVRNRRTFARR